MWYKDWPRTIECISICRWHCINWKKWNRNKTTFVETENVSRKFGLHINQGKTKYMIVERKNISKQNKIGQSTIKNYSFERVENFKYLGVTLNEEIQSPNRFTKKNKKC